MIPVVVERKSATYSFPAPVLAEAERLMSLHADGKSKWVVMSAAMLALAALDDDERQILCGKVKAADGDDVGLDDLIARARAGELLDELEQEATERRERAEEARRAGHESRITPAKRTAITGRGGKARVVTTPLPKSPTARKK